MSEIPPQDQLYYQPEQPVGADAGALFDASGVRHQLDRIGSQIAATANSGESTDRAFTFLVSGHWGVGKSSALGYVEHIVKRDARRKVVFARYHAPLYETRAAGARATMLLEVVHALSAYRELDARGGSYQDLTDFIFDVTGKKPSPDDGIENPDENARLERTRLRIRLALGDALDASVIATTALEERLPQLSRPPEGPQLTTVVLIDDLDRCESPAFVRDVLVATRHWSAASNHYFVIAADENRVRTALAEKLPAAKEAADGGLGKYVHVTVRIPAQIPETSRAARDLFRHWVENAFLEKNVQRALLNQLPADDDAAHSERPGLLDPLLAGCTPRVLKERFNSLTSELAGLIDDYDDYDQRVQYAVMKIRWPQEFADRIEPAQLEEDGSATAWCRHLRDLGRMVIANPVVGGRNTPGRRRQQAEMVARLSRRSGLKLNGADPELALYLAAWPEYPWLAAELRLSFGDGRSSGTLAVASGRFSESSNTELVDALAELQGSLGDNSDLMLAAFRRADPLLDRTPRIPAEEAALIGNAALLFDKAGLVSEALRLHVYAARADPDHPDVNLNLVSFVISQGRAELYADCEQILSRLRPSAGGDDLWSERAELLRVRLDIARRRPVRKDRYDALVERASATSSNLTAHELSDLIRTVPALGHYEVVEAIGRRLLEAGVDSVTGAPDPVEQARSVQAVADSMWPGPNASHGEFAAELYLFLMRTGTVRHLPRESQAAVLVNLARVLRKHGSSAPAAYLLWHANRIDPNSNTRRLLAAYYSEMGDPGTARSLIEGRPARLEVPPAQPPFPQPLLRPCPPARELVAPWFPENTGLDPLLPELWAAE